MLGNEQLEYIGTTVKEAVNEAFEQLGIGKKVKLTENSPFKRVEQILWNYTKFQGIVEEKEAQIREVLATGMIPKKTNPFEYNPSTNVVNGVTTDEETVEAVVNALQADIVWVQQVIARIDLALDTVRNSVDFDLLCDYYFGGMDLESLGLKYSMDRKTAARHKNALVRDISIQLFPKETLTDIVGDII